MKNIKAIAINANGVTDLDTDKPLANQISNGVAWVHYEGDLTETRCSLESEFSFSPLVMNTLCHEYTRPRNLVDENDDLLVTVRAIVTDKENGNHLASLRCWVSQSLVITVSKEPLTVVHGLVKRYRSKARGIDHGHHILWDLSRGIVEDLTAYVSSLDIAVDELEDLWDERRELDTHKLHQLRLDVSHARRYLTPQLDAFLKIASTVYEFHSGKEEKQLYLIRWKELANEIKRDLETTAEMRERIVIMRDALQQRSTETANKIMFLLSIVATFFLPLTFIASMLGMNVTNIPGSQFSNGFWWVSGLMVLVALLQWFFFKKWKWLR